MGRDAGFIALHTAIGTGAEAVLVPEYPTNIKKLCDYLLNERRKNKTSGIVIVAEGDEAGGAMRLPPRSRDACRTMRQESLRSAISREVVLRAVLTGCVPASWAMVLLKLCLMVEKE